MSDPKDVIFHAIRVLRSRRVRPSDSKIAWFTRREFFLSEETTSHTLEELVRCGDILRVVYKGGTSYRVAPHKIAASNKLLKPPTKKVKFTPTPTDILRPLLSAIAACENNATKERIAQVLADSDNGHLVDRLDTLLQKELRVGLIGRKLTPSATPSGGRNTPIYFITRSAPIALITNRMKNFPPKTTANTPCEENAVPPPETNHKKVPAPFEQLHLHLKRLQQQKQDAKESESPDAKDVSNIDDSPPSLSAPDVSPEAQTQDNKPISRRGRPRKPPAMYEDLTSFTTKRGRPPKMGAPVRGGKPFKRARKVFDPSDASGKRKCASLSDSSSGAGTGQRCDVCNQTTQSTYEELLICHRCSARAHPSCLGYSTELAIKSRLGPWTCMDCKHCSICNMDHNIGTLIFCDECDCAFHLTCHQPPLDEQPHGSWICFSCSPNAGQNVYDSLPGLPTPRDSPVPDEESRGSLGSWEHTLCDPRIPNASAWSVDDVIDYFQEKGFIDYANVFREQDIDGTALLMLTRSDVLTGLDLKLGPALKIYKHVRILQTRLPNPPLP